jgi:hypothetical protein
MDKLVTVLRVSYPQELWIIKGRLESEGIECFIQDELTVQAYSLYSNAIGGVKLQVFEKDEQNALALLTELGYLKEEPIRTDLLTQIDKKTSNFWFLKRLPVTGRVILLTLIISFTAVTLLYFAIKPSSYDLLITTNWCVSKIYFNNQLVGPDTQQQIFLEDLNGNKLSCETLELRKDGVITLPGIKSYIVSGNWKLNDDETISINADTLKAIYNGKYYIDISANSLVLKSPTTTIYANRSIY